MTAASVEIVEVGPRDGLQNEAQAVSTEDKLRLIDRAVNAGIRRLEIASFVHPKRVPQMADAEEVIAKAPKSENVSYIGLVMNRRGAERALETEIDQLGAITLCSETFAQKNQGQSARETLETACELIRLANAAGRVASVTIGSAFGCPFEGEIAEADVIEYAQRLAEAEPCEIALADTIGVADPWRVRELFDKLHGTYWTPFSEQVSLNANEDLENKEDNSHSRMFGGGDHMTEPIFYGGSGASMLGPCNWERNSSNRMDSRRLTRRD